MRYSVQPRDGTFVNCYGFYLLLKVWIKRLVKNIRKNVRGTYNQKRIDHTKQSATDAF